MKAVLLLTVLTVLVLLPKGGDAWIEGIKEKWQNFKDKAKEKWNNLKGKIIEKLKGRDLGDLDFDQNGAIDQQELEAGIGSRHARDLWDLMDAEGAMSLDEFERNVRDLDELHGDD